MLFIWEKYKLDIFDVLQDARGLFSWGKHDGYNKIMGRS
jgi:hypothetical protein